MLTLSKKAFTDYFLSLLVLLFFILSLQNIDLVGEGGRHALLLCGRAVIPTLFPFLVLSDLLLSFRGTSRILSFLSRPFSYLFGLSSQGGTVFLLGNIFGFPMGARAAAQAYVNGKIEKSEAERLILFSSGASPFFLIGSVGAEMLHAPKKGVYLYLLQLSVSFCCALLLRFSISRPAKKSVNCPIAAPKERFSFSKTVQKAVKQSLFISGYILFFSTLSSVISPFIKSSFLSRLFATILEIGTGVSLAAAVQDKFTLPLCAFGVCFSGLSVYFQSVDTLSECDLSLKPYLPVKLLCGASAFFLTLLFSPPR